MRSDDLGYLDQLFKPLTARDLREAGIALVEENAGDWKERARAMVLAGLQPGWTGLAEDMRALLTDAGLDQPHSPNCWGALTMWCVRNGYLEALGPVENTRDPKSHASYTKRYQRTALR